MKKTVRVIGGGLAGCEAAWQLARAGIFVELYEMRPGLMTPAHSTSKLGELVCSNSLGSFRLENASGLLKEEMRLLGSLIIEAADATRVPAGGALAVDREMFSGYITDKIENHPNISVIREEVKDIPEGNYTVIATGPLSSPAISEAIKKIIKQDYLYFYDAAAPIVVKDSLDPEIVFKASRYGRGEDYLNCPMSREVYERFWHELVNADTVTLKEFEDQKVFEGCMPIEVMAKRGIDTLRFGPLKPVGIRDPRTGKEPYAVVQLRQDNRMATLYNMVGFQTNLLFGEQKRVFSMIPGMENAEFVRYGVMHRNTYINSPKLLNSHYGLKSNPYIFFAGQITGVEGYVESASSGLMAGLTIALLIHGQPPIDFPDTTAIGALAGYISDSRIENFQPMNINFGIISPLDTKIRSKRERNLKLSERSLRIIKEIINNSEIQKFQIY
ncbi:MAG: methylenetetrahydrofolate--tRNA-(uracil(54)-C(5))-methyltransferase (FADH(2)-oxidizing) TrmFO [Clostridiales bacterium]|nr:methylenetetrahydrofolate--tRNA-(uracil(54)-C(5))-methyltransferase (FADH(2)-oxidizing) TrmFO [Clostridiales bacterium]